MLTAAGQTVDRVVGLEMGADDYVAKPFDPRELLARVKSVLRRTRERAAAAAPAQAEKPEAIRMGRCTLDLAAQRSGLPSVRSSAESATLCGVEWPGTLAGSDR